MTPKEKAEELMDKMFNCTYHIKDEDAKQCALIATQGKYKSLREQLFNLRACGVIESAKVYMHRIDELIKEEQEVLKEIELM